MKLTARNSLVFLIILSLMSFISIMFSIFTGIVLNSSLESNVFKLNPVVIPKFENTDNMLKILPMKSAVITKHQIEDFTKKLIMEYITVRYTVNGSGYMMMENTGIGDKSNNPFYGAILKIPSYIPETNSYNFAYNSFVSGKNNDVEEISNLMSQNITRSVKILSEPYRYNDRWKTLVEFVYKNPDTNFLSEAQRERWEINMEIGNIGGRSLYSVPFNPSYIFAFEVKWIEKIRK